VISHIRTVLSFIDYLSNSVLLQCLKLNRIIAYERSRWSNGHSCHETSNVAAEKPLYNGVCAIAKRGKLLCGSPLLCKPRGRIAPVSESLHSPNTIGKRFSIRRFEIGSAPYRTNLRLALQTPSATRKWTKSIAAGKRARDSQVE
jgi:hypothetical protein